MNTFGNTVGLTLLLSGISLVSPGQVNAQQTTPECVYLSTDIDGDGFGYENNATCVITENSSGVAPASNECIDDNADGWGWNGVESCVVPIPETDCFDTAPIGDGWGWDGVTSCRVGTVSQPEFNELEEIKRHFVDIPFPRLGGPSRSAVISCPGSSRTYYLDYNGLLAGDNGRNGAWTSGVSTSDNIVRLSLGFVVPLTITSDGVWEGTLQSDSTRCQWLN